MIRGIFRFRDPDLNTHLGRAFAWGLIRATSMQLKVIGLENIEAGQFIYVGNHQHLLDFQVYGSIFPSNTVIVGKRELVWIPFFGAVFYTNGNVLIHRHHREKALNALGQIAEAMRTRGVSVFMFPEGTRNRSYQGLLPFKKGAFHLAIETQTPLVPIVISSMRRMFDEKTGLADGGVIKVKVLAPISVAGFTKRDADALLNKVRNQMEQALIELEQSF